MPVDDVGRFVLPAGTRYLGGPDLVLKEMLDGWRNQQLSRNLAFSTIEQREFLVRRFVAAVNEYPWLWTSEMIEEFFGDLRVERRVTRSTVRSYQGALRLFSGYVCSPDYGWSEQCFALFGTHPVQLLGRWNSAINSQEHAVEPKKRAYTRDELQTLFDYADDVTQTLGESGSKGWLAAYRDATVFKVAYGWGLRERETLRLQRVDFYRNPQAREFGRYGLVHVRWGKANRGAPPKRRSVLTVFDWTPDVVDDWIRNGLPHSSSSLNLFTTERGTVLSGNSIRQRLSRYIADLDFPPGLDFHSFRRSYATHLIESDIDAKFVQDQLGHEYASTTGIYDCTSDDYRQRTLRRALESIINESLNPCDHRGSESCKERVDLAGGT